MTLAYCFTGSFCTHSKSIEALDGLCDEYDILPVFSPIVASEDTRFGKSEDLKTKVEAICKNKIITSIKEAEEKITKGNISAVVIAPCTGNTLSKIAHGITDTAVTMAAKAELRNRKPVVIALATNDGLGANLKNIGLCFDKKHVYFVPLSQDDYIKKETSLVCDFSKIKETVKSSIDGKQLQPFLLQNNY